MRTSTPESPPGGNPSPAQPVVPEHELLRLIGSGSYGEVWIAQNVLGSFRAVKIVRRDQHASPEAFEREFRGLQRFEPVSRSHEGLIDILTLGLLPADAGFYYIMELAEAVGGNHDSVFNNPASVRARDARKSDSRFLNSYQPRTLRADLKTRGALPADETTTLGLKLTAAVAHLHAQGLVHRDIKPSNILFVAGEPKLADAGLVAPLDDARSLVGTVGYIAPEGPGTPQADIYALGKVLYEAAFAKNRHDFPQVGPDIASRPDHTALLEVNEIIAKACATDSRDRYQSVNEMHADLELLASGRSVRRRQVWGRAVKAAKRTGFAMTVVAVISSVVVTVLLHQARPRAIEWSNNEEANRAYRKAINIFHQNADGSFAESARLFELAVQKDPNFGRANARLARSYVWQGPNDPVMLARARPFAYRAFALNPESDEANCAMASIKTLLEHDWAAAEQHHLKAIRLNAKGSNAEDNFYAYASFLTIVGRMNEAVEQVEKALALGSRSLVWMQNAAFVLLAARQYDRAIGIVKDIIEQQPSSRTRLTGFLAAAYRGKGDYLESLRLEEAADPDRVNNPDEVKAHYAELQEAWTERGEAGYWKQVLESTRNGETNLVRLAMLHARVHEDKTALQYLNQAAEKMPVQLAFEINREPAFDRLRQDPQFVAVRRKLKFKDFSR